MSAGAPDRIRLGMIRKQNIIYVAVIAVGLFLIVTSQMIDQRLLTEGIAFIMIGFVGMLMSFTTMDIGASIKEAIREVGRQNAESSASIMESIREVGRQNAESSANIKEIALGIKNAVSDAGRQNAESSASIMESIREVGRQNAESSANIKESIREVGRQNAESSANIKESIREVGRQNAESSANIMESIREVGRQNLESDASARKAMLDSLAQSNRGFGDTLKEIAKSQSIMVALLKNMNEPREAPGEMPDGGKV